MSLIEKLEQRSIHIFIKNRNVKASTGQPLDFREHPFLWEPYADTSKYIVCRKAAQIGFSELAIIKSYYMAGVRDTNIIYTLPTVGDARAFVQSKVNPLLKVNSPNLTAVGSLEMKKIQTATGESNIHYRGTLTERATLMISSDLNIHDELDRSDLANVEFYSSRLQHSKDPRTWWFSNPSAPNVGTDKFWQKSDQKHWFVTCKKPTCAKEQYLTMDNVMSNGTPTSAKVHYSWFGCKHCQTELDRTKGFWRAKFPGREISGYWISLLMAPWVPAKDVLKLREEKTDEYFDNFVLGIPHVGNGNVVTRDMVYANLTKRVNPQGGQIVIGVDPGKTIRFVVGNEDGLFYHGETKVKQEWTAHGFQDESENPYRDVEDLMRKYPKSIVVIDQGGDLIASRKLRNKYPGRVYLAYYKQDRDSDELFKWDDNEYKVFIDRNRTISHLVGEIGDKRFPLWNGTEADWNNFATHWTNIYRVEAENLIKGGSRGVVYEWKRSDRDDFVHCLSGDTLITTSKGDVPIRNVNKGDMVLTRLGYRPVEWAGQTGVEKVKTYKIGDRKLTATENHPIWTSRGFKEISQIQKASFLTVSLSGVIQTQQDAHSESTSIPQGITENEASEHCIKRYGRRLMEKYQKVMSFITLMRIRSIMILETWNSSLAQNMPQTTSKSIMNVIGMQSSQTSTTSENSPTNGGALIKAGNGILNMLIKVLFWLSQSLLSALNAMGKAQHSQEVEASFAPVDAEIVTTQGNGERNTNNPVPVYNIHVKDVHEYFANGILTHNCSVYYRAGIDRFKGLGSSFIAPNE